MDVFPTSLPRRNLFRAGLVTTAVFITAGCAFQKPEEVTSSAASPDAQTILKLVTGPAIQSLVPLKISFWGSEFGCAELLLRPQPDGNPTDWLLKDTVNESDRTWRLSLREGIAFQNGNSLSADQSAALMTRHLANSKTVTGQLPRTTAIADQDKSLLLTTQAPTPGLRNTLADEACFTVFDLPSYEGTGDDPQRLIDARIYTGPYVLVSLNDEKLMMTIDLAHWDGTLGLGGIEIFFASDAGAWIEAVQNGEVGITLYPPTQQAKSLEDDARAKLNLGEPGGPSLYLAMNIVKPVLVEAKVRRALLRLVDYKALATDVMRGSYKPVSLFYDPKLSYVIDIWKTDMAEAEQLLGEVGATKSDSGWLLSNGEPIAFELLTYPQQPDSDTLALVLQARSKEYGIRATI